MKSKTQKRIDYDECDEKRFARIEFQVEACWIDVTKLCFPMGLSTVITILAINIMYSQKVFK